MTVATESEYREEFKELIALLKDGPKSLATLPKKLQDEELLDYFLNKRKIELGRPDHSFQRVTGISEVHELRPIITVISDKISWTSLDQPWHISSYELLAQEKDLDPKLRLHIRLGKGR
jgi:hypothetical protein